MERKSITLMCQVRHFKYSFGVHGVAVFNKELSALVTEYHQLERELEVAYYKWRSSTVRPKMFCGDGPFRRAHLYRACALT